MGREEKPANNSKQQEDMSRCFNEVACGHFVKKKKHAKLSSMNLGFSYVTSFIYFHLSIPVVVWKKSRKEKTGELIISTNA